MFFNIHWNLCLILAFGPCYFSLYSNIRINIGIDLKTFVWLSNYFWNFWHTWNKNKNNLLWLFNLEATKNTPRNIMQMLCQLNINFFIHIFFRNPNLVTNHFITIYCLATKNCKFLLRSLSLWLLRPIGTNLNDSFP